jgi:GDP-4-dehydro-6-deoxy-D-mannose reductase
MVAHSVLVTGGNGFVGRHFLPALATRLPHSKVHLSDCDVTIRDAVFNEVDRIRPNVCVHLAAIAAIPNARCNPDRAWQVNLHGTLNVGYALLTHAPRCKLIFASSSDAYGSSFRSNHPLDETAPLAPLNVYGATKAAADLALGALAAAEGLNVVRMRAFNQVGPGQTADYAIPAFAKQIARIGAGLQEPVLRVGDLDPKRDFLDVRDVCSAYAQCVARVHDISGGTILNIASGTPRRIGDVLDMLIAAAGVTVRVESDETRWRTSDIQTACGDASRARSLLKWAPCIPWDQTIRDVLEDWRTRIGGKLETRL